MNPTTGSPGTGVQHLANFTRQLSSPSTMMPDSLRRAPGISLAGAGVREGGVPWGQAFGGGPCRFYPGQAGQLSRIRFTAFWAVMPP